ncbi:MOSC domain-containing protein [Oceaniglobus ichthyenteri]|uniref:MOSC domain-containing protein n=1 Tax=Oceaniglobus ichthyenteri TaxID=2136177 RepID=UPI000D3D7A66|nr:MOSC N-terminal beta barrel domain-containing protein [Oceaniglobus ichthyenteri]
MGGAAHLVQIWRHPIKSHGREALQKVTLSAGQTMPWDRRWAIAHEMSQADDTAWARCANFSIGAKVPGLLAIDATLDETTGTVTLTHPDRPDFTFDPDGDATAFLDWVCPLMPQNRAASARVVRVPGRGMADSSFPSVSIMNMASHRAVEQKLARPLDIRRWRGNLWLDGLGPWEEHDWLDKDIRIGEVTLRPVERIERCMSPTANPETGLRDTDILGTLETWGHRDFGLRAEVITGGTLHLNDKARLI